MTKNNHIHIQGASQNNLKGFDLKIPHGQLTVITGPSGSGKSSLAFQTLYAEGQRRYVETFSPYVRQFFDRMDKPAVKRITGIPPAIAIEQKNAIRTSRSTVGTLTELNDYLKLLFARVAKGYDPISGDEIRPNSPETIMEWVTDQHSGENILVLFPIDSPPEDRSIVEFYEFLSSQGYLRLLVNGALHRTDEQPSLTSHEEFSGDLYIIQDRIKVSSSSSARLVESFERALLLGKGKTSVAAKNGTKTEVLRTFSDEWYNPETGVRLQPPTSGLFSFNSPIGACVQCRGFGRVIGIDLKKAIPDPSLSIKEQCVKPFQGERGRDSQRDLIRLAPEAGVSITLPFSELSEEEQDWVLYGEQTGHQTSDNDLPASEKLWLEGKWYGIQGFFDWMESKAYKMHVRIFLAKYRSYTVCPSCRGKRLKPESLCYKINGFTLPQLWSLPVEQFLPFIENLPAHDSRIESDKTIQLVFQQIANRLKYLERVGLGYLTLDRQARTLSGGEIARVNLTSCLGASLTHTMFVLDEPTVGLHPRDIDTLVEVMHDLRDKGNTLIVVEHEEVVMMQADHLIDMGPGAGHLGGEVLFSSTLNDSLSAQRNSPTLAYLQGERSIPVPIERRQATQFLSLNGVMENNLKSVDVEIPLGVLCCVTGVSGSGKSTLIERGLYQNLLSHFDPQKVDQAAPIRSLEGIELIDSVSFIDQSPLSQTPRSTPAVYLGAFGEIRQLFAMTDEAKLRGYTPGYFSFNSGDGRCERCSGNGFEKVEMQFLSDLYLTCPDCNGTRYQKTALEIAYRGKTIADVLDLTVGEARSFFTIDDESLLKTARRRHEHILGVLSALVEVGLTYLRLGQALNTLSGGEAQRVKIASLLLESQKSSKTRESALVTPKLQGTADTPRAMKAKLDALAKRRKEGMVSEPKKGALLILDEPTTGLHFGDIAVLLKAFERLIEAGHSLLIVEHNLEVIKCADHVIDLGPEAGTNGGQVVGTGTPEMISTLKTPTGIYLKKALSPKKNTRSQLPLSTVANSSGIGAQNAIEIRGARHHNLKNLDLDLPHHSFNVVTGLSGSGKSTLAFDLVFAEGQRRFLDAMSPYARQFAEQLEKPDVDRIAGLPPTVAIEQRISRGGGKSTVATITELYHFLRLLFAKLGIQHCPVSGEPVQSQTEAAILEKVLVHAKVGRIHVMAPVVRGRKGFHTDVTEKAERMGYQALFVDHQIIDVTDFEPLTRYQEHDIDIIICAGSKLDQKVGELELKLSEALKLSKGFIRLLDHKNKLHVYSTERVSPVTGESFQELDPADFSFNSPRGWCPECRGYGTITSKRFRVDRYDSAIEAELAEEKARNESDDPESTEICPSCQGSRLKENANHVLLPTTGDSGSVSLPDVTRCTVDEAAKLVTQFSFSGREAKISRDILPEISQRLQFLSQVGLGYLSLNRSATTLSGGEAQRIRLASQLGSNLQGVLYVLDEPTIGLHPRDNEALLDTLQSLQKKGNSLLIVEHDEETMARANQVIDLGPGAGRLGGEVMAQGTLKQLMRRKNSVTGQALKNPINHPIRGQRRPIDSKTLPNKDWLELSQCHLHNLKEIDVRLPKGRLTVITGVSGSGKSTFMRGTLEPVAKILTTSAKKASKKLTKAQKAKIKPYCGDVSGFDQYKYVFEVDQSPIGKTSRSTPATYVKLFDEIRKIYAQLPEAKMRGFTASRFSFNNAIGQCADCKGNGSIKVEMDFLPSTRVPCETCRGERYNPATLTVRYNGKTIGDVLRMSIDEAAEFFSAYPKVSRTLKLLTETGLGYLQLGQPSPTLSGGEAQRLKLVTELTKGRKNVSKAAIVQKNLYLIEEPSIGLHLNDVKKLIEVLHRLTDEGHTVVVVEHHPALMAEADYIIDFGPEAGPNGGTICASGTPEDVAKSKNSHTAQFLPL